MEKKNTIKIAVCVTAFLILGILYLNLNQRKESQGVVTEQFSERETVKVTTSATSIPDKEQLEIYVHVCGEVNNPGVYRFAKEPRVIDVVKQAGGFTKKADKAGVNLAEIVTDGTQLIIEAKTKKIKHKTEEDVNSNRLNINTASKEELMTLSGIGESKATQILSYRESNGKFHAIEDIMKISGIKEGVFNKIKDYITV